MAEEYGNEAAAASSGMPQFDLSTWGSQIFWLVVTFGILYLALSRFILPNLRTSLATRSDRIADDLDSASRMQREAEEAEKAFQASLRDARAKAANLAESTRQSVDAEINAELDEADAAADAQARAAEERIRDIKSAALANIDAVAIDVTKAVIKDVTGKSVTDAVVKTAVQKA